MHVTLCDVGPRDGLQNEPDTLAPEVRAELVRRLAATGLPRIEAVSFVNPERVPQMAGAEEVVATVGEVDAELSGLVLNERGWERLAATAIGRVNVTLAATESFNQRNGNASLEEAAARVERILAAADRPSTATISVAFGCPFEGNVDPGVVAALADRLVAAGAGEIVLADTIGVATPGPVRRLLERSRASASRSAATSTTRATPASPAPGRRSRRAPQSSTRRLAASAAAPSRRARPATSPPRTCSMCSTARGSRRESTSTR